MRVHVARLIALLTPLTAHPEAKPAASQSSGSAAGAQASDGDGQSAQRVVANVTISSDAQQEVAAGMFKISSTLRNKMPQGEERTDALSLVKACNLKMQQSPNTVSQFRAALADADKENMPAALTALVQAADFCQVDVPSPLKKHAD